MKILNLFLFEPTWMRKKGKIREQIRINIAKKQEEKRFGVYAFSLKWKFFFRNNLLQLAWSVMINEFQGQTFEEVGFLFRESVFAHGSL